ncbi:Serine/threonine protein kinase [Rubritalea squalenifaciens DSM 18772]|uniref:Serine/threonine protein kinase n=1 Tax=Rubritalea squalenifaciens DSM 18772 TaxID=1123071 RepID=A0A1M6BDV4_9BACT|nr:protein kinase [Rubritalea squalenifaciens]SHI46944.1 Serine/threonine protein kinase [Rubritalea squalenifaciens DSM 18772]
MSERYQTGDCLGRGRAGSVYEAYDTQQNKSVILRRFDVPEEEYQNNRWRSEYLTITNDLKRIKHPNILEVLDSDFDEEGPFIVTDQAPGIRLSKMMPGQGTGIPLKAIYHLASQMLDAYQVAMSFGFYHYALSPSSILGYEHQDNEYHFTLMDLGHSKLIPLIANNSNDALAKTLDPALLAPEVYEGNPQGIQSSLYMLGQLLYWVSAGGHPLAGLSLRTAHAKHKAGEMPYLKGYRADMPDNFRKWIYRLIEPNPDRRPESIIEARMLMPASDEVNAEIFRPQPRKMDRRDAEPDYS